LKVINGSHQKGQVRSRLNHKIYTYMCKDPFAKRTDSYEGSMGHKFIYVIFFPNFTAAPKECHTVTYRTKECVLEREAHTQFSFYSLSLSAKCIFPFTHSTRSSP
jgi:hypothetical protein